MKLCLKQFVKIAAFRKNLLKIRKSLENMKSRLNATMLLYSLLMKTRLKMMFVCEGFNMKFELKVSLFGIVCVRFVIKDE